MSLLGFFPGVPGGPEVLIVAIIALLLFGKRLPEVARSLGKGIVEFKKGVSGIEDEVNQAANQSSTRPRSSIEDDDDEVTAPKFEPPTQEPKSSDED